MPDDTRLPVRAVLRNAIAWAAAWGAGGGGIAGVLALFTSNPAIDSLPERLGHAVFAAAAWGVRFAIVGAVMGAAFAVAIRLSYRGRRLADIDPVRFGILGAVVGGVGVPLFLQTMNVLTGGPLLAWSMVTDDAVWATVFGAVAAVVSILLARRADRRADDAEPASLGANDAAGALPPGAFTDVRATPRSRVH